jgi:hypothetical protein
MKRAIMTLVLMLGVLGKTLAGNEHGHKGEKCDITPIVQPKDGVDGKDGRDGIDGVGQPGRAGVDASADAYHDDRGRMAVNVGAAVQWHEWDNQISINSGYRYDLNHGDHSVDAIIIGYRFGKNASDRKIDALQAQVAALTGYVAMAQKDSAKALAIAGAPPRETVKVKIRSEGIR